MEELRQVVKRESLRTLFWAVISLALAVTIGHLVL